MSLTAKADYTSMKKPATLLFAAVATLAAGQSADASLILTLQAGANPATVITDNLAGFDSDTSVGSIVSVQANYFGFATVITVGTSNSPGVGGEGLLQIQSLDVRNIGGGTGTLTITLSDTDFAQPGGAGSVLALKSSVAGTLTSNTGPGTNSFQFTSFADPANGQPAGPVATTTQVFTSGAGSPQALVTDPGFVSDTQTTFVKGGAYSLSNKAVMTLSAGSQMNFSGTTLATVPEPATSSVLLLGGLAAVSRRRRD